VTCFVLGSKVDPTESGDTTHSNGKVTIRAMTYETFIRRAERRMLGLRTKLRSAPFMQGQDLDGLAEQHFPVQSEIDFSGQQHAARDLAEKH
jgi:hypothetical protein